MTDPPWVARFLENTEAGSDLDLFLLDGAQAMVDGINSLISGAGEHEPVWAGEVSERVTKHITKAAHR
jgi:hypothetical protein